MRHLLHLLSPVLWFFRRLNRLGAPAGHLSRWRLLSGLILLPILATVGMFIGFAFLWVLAWKRFIAKPAPVPVSKQKGNEEVLEAEYRVLRKQSLSSR